VRHFITHSTDMCAYLLSDMAVAYLVRYPCGISDWINTVHFKCNRLVILFQHWSRSKYFSSGDIVKIKKRALYMYRLTIVNKHSERWHFCTLFSHINPYNYYHATTKCLCQLKTSYRHARVNADRYNMTAWYQRKSKHPGLLFPSVFCPTHIYRVDYCLK